jgi:hypothetical protein
VREGGRDQGIDLLKRRKRERAPSRPPRRERETKIS